MKRSRPGPNRGRKKPKDMPRRPLSAYNLFFKTQRPILISQYEQGQPQPDFDANIQSALDAGKDKEKGAVFQAASRTLAERWKKMTAKEREQYERQADIELKNYRKEIAQYHEKRDKHEHEMSSSASAAAAAPSPAVNMPMAAASAASFSEQTPSASAFLQRTAQPTTVAKAVVAPSAVQTQAPIAAQFADLNTQNIAAAALLLNNTFGSVNLANAGMPGLQNTILQVQAAQLLAQMGQVSSLNVQDLTLLVASLQGGYSLSGNQPDLNQLLTLLAILQRANQPPTAQSDPAPALVQPPPVPQPVALQANEPNMANLLSNLGDEAQRALLEQLLEVQRNRQSSDAGQQAGDAPPQSPGSS